MLGTQPFTILLPILEYNDGEGMKIDKNCYQGSAGKAQAQFYNAWSEKKVKLKGIRTGWLHRGVCTDKADRAETTITTPAPIRTTKDG